MEPTDVTQIKLPPTHDWRTSDEDEINKRRYRARTENLKIKNLDPAHPIYSNFEVRSLSGLTYQAEVRSVSQRRFACDCVDFQINGLGTCKHIEAVLLYIEARHKKLFLSAQANGSSRIDVVPDLVSGFLRIEGFEKGKLGRLQGFIGVDGRLLGDDPQQSLIQLREARIPELRISQEVEPWLQSRRQLEERKLLLREYEQKVQSGEWPSQETLAPLYPYQREGMLHLAFKERALLADEMGLGKTIQAIAACALLHRLEKASRVLVVTPASLKTEWEEQIQRFTKLPYRLIYGARRKRLQLYSSAAFFTVVNYEQMLADALEVNARLRPDIIILDEAQRIKNWDTKTAQAIKRLRSRYAFILTGTPIENRIDDLHSLMSFLEPAALGPLFRFNRDFFELDDRGRPCGYKNLGELHSRIKPFMLRRRKAEVETELPDRTDRTFFVSMSGEQKNRYLEHEAEVARLASIAKTRPLTQQQSEKLMRELAMMRMTCDTNYILDPKERACPKLAELTKLLEECRDNSEMKALIFSEWARMLELVRELCERLRIGYALHTGSVPQRRRRAEILMFKNDPNCRVFLSTDSGSTGLNLQNASIVINCDLPWNPAKLEQRIARAWRKHQTKPVTVIHLVSEHTIEHRMLGTLSTKQALADGVLDLRGNLSEIKYRAGRQAFLSKLQQLMAPASLVSTPPPKQKVLPADRSLAFSRVAREKLGSALLRCEERYPSQGAHSVLVVVVDRDAGLWQPKLAAIHEEFFAADGSDPLTPVKLEVIDRATDEALQRLISAGLAASATRATRELFSTANTEGVQLTDGERQQALAHRKQADRKLKMARLLGDGELMEEEREALLQSALHLGRALAVEHRLAEPSGIAEMLRPPVSLCFGEALSAISSFAGDESSLPASAMAALNSLLSAAPPNTSVMNAG